MDDKEDELEVEEVEEEEEENNIDEGAGIDGMTEPEERLPFLKIWELVVLLKVEGEEESEIDDRVGEGRGIADGVLRFEGLCGDSGMGILVKEEAGEKGGVDGGWVVVVLGVRAGDDGIEDE